MDLAGSLRSVKERIEKAAARAGRDANDVKLVAVTKGVEPGRIIEAVRAGQLTFGENYAQEFRLKKEIIDRTVVENVEWHFIGRLQRNKVKYLIGEAAFDPFPGFPHSRARDREAGRGRGYPGTGADRGGYGRGRVEGGSEGGRA